MDRTGADYGNGHGGAYFFDDVYGFLMLPVSGGKVEYDDAVAFVVTVALCQSHRINADLMQIIKTAYRSLLIQINTWQKFF